MEYGLNDVKSSLGDWKAKRSKSIVVRSNIPIILLLLVWIFNGALRSYFKSYSNHLFFLHVPICLYLIFVGFKRINETKNGTHPHVINSLFLLTGIFLTVWTIIQTIFLHFSFQQSLYAFTMYPLSFLTIPFITKMIDLDLLILIMKIWSFSICINLFFSIAQVLNFGFFFQTYRINDKTALTTFGPLVRACGTFTAPSAYTFYLALSLGILLLKIQLNLGNKYLTYIFLIFLFVQILLAGSRSLPLYLSLSVALSVLVAPSELFNKFQSIFLYLFIILILFMIVRFSFLSNVLESFLLRVSIAGQQEDTLQRMIDSFSSFTQSYGSGLLGAGQGTFGRGNLGYQSNLWIENDLQKNIFENGDAIGTVFIFLRIILSIGILNILRKSSSKMRSLLAFMIAPIIITFTVGQLTNQGSLNIGLIISVAFVLAMNQSSSIKNFLILQITSPAKKSVPLQ